MRLLDKCAHVCVSVKGAVVVASVQLGHGWLAERAEYAVARAMLCDF
jgi:hypothetical protein